MEPWHYWTLIGFSLIALEMLSGDFVFACFGAAAFAAAGAAGGFEAPLKGQLGTFAIAAAVFSRKPSDLSLASEPRTTLGWDSLAHMALVTAAEKHFDVTFSARDILAIGRLEHLVEAVANRRDRQAE